MTDWKRQSVCLKIFYFILFSVLFCVINLILDIFNIKYLEIFILVCVEKTSNEKI